MSPREQFDQKSPLDELIKEGARRMLQSAIDAEVEAFVAQHEGRRDCDGRLQDLRIYERALSKAEIGSLSESP